MLNFFQKNEYSDLIYVLDFLLNISIRGEEIKKNRKIDLEFYRLLNRPNIYQEIFHTESLPISRKNKKISKEFADFIHKLSAYIEYDVMNDFVWAQVAEDANKQKQIQTKVINYRKEVLSYLLNKAVITADDFESITSTPLKSLTD